MTEYELIYKLVEYRDKRQDISQEMKGVVDQFLTVLLERLKDKKFVSKSVQ
jgi:hypothetical protein